MSERSTSELRPAPFKIYVTVDFKMLWGMHPLRPVCPDLWRSLPCLSVLDPVVDRGSLSPGDCWIHWYRQVNTSQSISPNSRRLSHVM